MKIDLSKLTIKSTHEHLVKGDFTAVELADTYLAEIKKKNPEMNVYLEVYDDVHEQAKVADKMIAEKKATMLTGIPLGLKDNILVKGHLVSAASKMLANYRATYDATAIAKLKKEGAVFLGRTNMDEFAMGSSTQNSAYGVTKNPHDMSRVPGGSSGGATASVAMNGALAALGTDTGGSVRQPASFCGLVGLKPTYGSISRYGIIAMASSLDQIGPITKTVTDSEILWNVIKGKDAYDGTTITEDTYPKLPLKGKKSKIGVPYAFLNQGIGEDVLANFKESVDKLKALGHEIVDISLPNIGYSLAVYYVLMPAEVSSNLARLDGVKYGLHMDGANMIDDYFKTRSAGFGKETRRRIILGTYVLSSGYADAYYNKANQVKKLLCEDFSKAFAEVDLVLTPTTPTPAFKIGEKTTDPVQMYLADIFTVTANLVGSPAISIPSGFSKTEDGKDLPLGIQFTASHSREDLLFSVGKEFLGE